MKRVAYTIQRDRLEALLARLKAVLEQEPVVIFAYLYGSVLDADKVHDIDVGLYLRKSDVVPDPTIVDGLSAKLADAVSVPVDVRILNEAPLSFLYHVLRGRPILCRDEPLLTAMIEDVARRYLDLAPLLRQSTKDAFVA